jgi:hypothetical protein
VKLRSTTSLEAHKYALEIALDPVSLYVTYVNFEMTTNIGQDHSQRDQSRYARNTRGHTEIKGNTELILAEIARFQQQLLRDVERHHTSGCMLERYLDNLTSYAETVYYTISTSVDAPGGSENGSIKQQEGTSSIYHTGSSGGKYDDDIERPRKFRLRESEGLDIHYGKSQPPQKGRSSLPVRTDWVKITAIPRQPIPPEKAAYAHA